MERFFIRHDKETSILTIEVTEKIASEIIDSFKKQFPIEFLSVQVEKKLTVTTEDGVIYDNVSRYSVKIYADKVDHIFEAGKKLLRESIGNSFIQSDN